MSNVFWELIRHRKFSSSDNIRCYIFTPEQYHILYFMPEHKILSSLLCHFLNPDSTQWKPGIGITKWQFKEFSYIKCQDGIPEITYRECRGVLPSKIYFRCARESGFQFQFLRKLRAFFLIFFLKSRDHLFFIARTPANKIME